MFGLMQTSEDGFGSHRFAVIDVETSGLEPSEHDLLQVAAVICDATGDVVSTFESAVRPPKGPFSSVGPRHVHGITRRSLLLAPPASKVLLRFADAVRGCLITGHNIAFDNAFLENAATRAGVQLPLWPALCTLELSRSLDTDRSRRHRLADLCDRYGVTNDRPHDALADALATAKVLPRLLTDAGIDSVASLEPHLMRPTAS
jgi:DNA polymerase III subunit epsilon